MPATDALLAFERARHLGGAEAAVAFAQQIFRRAGAIVVIDIERDDLGHRFGVTAHAPEFSGVFRLERAAPAGSDRIDENEIGETQPGIRIVAQLGACGVAAAGAEIEKAGPGEAQMQEGGCGARSAVEHEGQRPVCRRALGHIGRIKNRCAALARQVVERQRAGRCRVGKPAVAGVDRMLGDRIGGQQPQHAEADVGALAGIFIALIVPARGAGILGCGSREREGKADRQRQSHDRVSTHGTPLLT